MGRSPPTQENKKIKDKKRTKDAAHANAPSLRKRLLTRKLRWWLRFLRRVVAKFMVSFEFGERDASFLRGDIIVLYEAAASSRSPDQQRLKRREKGVLRTNRK
ncbi:hypothetical protein CDAR_246361 [Caerostris darwini]|uniref:Uncharacterized protein n=1 Tax=Caerostris darwini TaxID=1538125 RepID=A0AAV4W9D5_9ARAC|nr:hypothetical protein CDAR_246361 [Caerostris darwini]